MNVEKKMFRIWTGEKMITTEHPFIGAGSFADAVMISPDGSVCTTNAYGLGMQPLEKLEKAIVMEYMPLKDVDKFYVCEGDILEPISGLLLRWVVKKRFGSFGITVVGLDGNMNWDEFHPINSEYQFIERKIIGNIYENPENLIQTKFH